MLNKNGEEGVGYNGECNLFQMRTNTFSGRFFKSMDEYIVRLKRMPKNQAYKESLEALKRTGVVTQDGKPKKHIVSDY